MNLHVKKARKLWNLSLKSGGRDKIDILFSQNDDMALGAIQAIEASGLQRGKDIVIVSVDGVKGAFQAMIEGKSNPMLNATHYKDHCSWKQLRRFSNGEQVDKMVYMEEGVSPGRCC